MMFDYDVDPDWDDGWSRAPHGLWTLDMPMGAKVLLGWLHSHSRKFLATVTMNDARRAMGGTSSIFGWFDALEAAGFVALVRGENGKPAKITLLAAPFRALCVRPNQSEIGSVTSPKSDRTEEQGEDQSSSLRSEVPVPTQVTTGTREKPGTPAAKVATRYWDEHKANTDHPPAYAFKSLMSVASACLKAGYDPDEIVAAMHKTRVMSAQGVTQTINEFRRAAETATTGPAIPGPVVKAFGAASPWLARCGWQIDPQAVMAAVTYFVTRHGFGVGETMLRLAVAIRDQGQTMTTDSLIEWMWKAKVDRFPGELADYPDAMERAFRNRYWRAS